jgi:hypothetical protein
MLRQIFINTIFLLFLFFVLNILLTKFSQKIFHTTPLFYRLFVAPGIIIHELSHVLACLLFGAKIKKVSFFDKKGGYVKHQPAKIPLVGQFFISFMPILGGLAGMLFLMWLFQYSHFFLPQIILTPNFWHNISFLFSSTLNFLQYNWHKWQLWLFLYLIISICLCLMPSTQDIKNGIKGLVAIIVLIAIVYYFNFVPDFLVTGLNGLGFILIFGIISQSFAFCFIFLFYFIKKIFTIFLK